MDRERENDTTQPPSELLLVYCFSWLCLVRHIPSICTDVTALTEGNHVRLIAKDKLLHVQWRWICDAFILLFFFLWVTVQRNVTTIFLYNPRRFLLILNVYGGALPLVTEVIWFWTLFSSHTAVLQSSCRWCDCVCSGTRWAWQTRTVSECLCAHNAGVDTKIKISLPKKERRV